MKSALDKNRELNKYNRLKEAESIASLPQQLESAWNEANKKKVKLGIKKISQVVVCGMGGSNLASELLRSVYSDQLAVPIILVRSYQLPNFVDKSSLIIISSYSGNTEEALSCFQEAANRKLPLICLSTGGQLASLAKSKKVPHWLLDAQLNPSGQPRYGVGLQLGAMLAIFSQLKLLKITAEEFHEVVGYLEKLKISFSWSAELKNNSAKQAAKFLKDGVPLVVSAGFLSANAHILTNQINESAKNLAYPYLLPELNHHLLDGLGLPPASARQIKFLFFNSSQFHPRVQKRFAITEKVLKQQRIEFMEYLINSNNRLAASLEIFLFGSYVSFYLAVLNRREPASIPWVDYLKKELAK